VQKEGCRLNAWSALCTRIEAHPAPSPPLYLIAAIHTPPHQAGTTVHWHGQDVPTWADGVEGVSQGVIPVGGTFSYRFKAQPAGTFWCALAAARG